MQNGQSSLGKHRTRFWTRSWSLWASVPFFSSSTHGSVLARSSVHCRLPSPPSRRRAGGGFGRVVPPLPRSAFALRFILERSALCVTGLDPSQRCCTPHHAKRHARTLAKLPSPLPAPLSFSLSAVALVLFRSICTSPPVLLLLPPPGPPPRRARQHPVPSALRRLSSGALNNSRPHSCATRHVLSGAALRKKRHLRDEHEVHRHLMQHHP